ncbi:MAG: TraB/GumN family protein [Rhodobacter sp.]|nr:TraB/GumN family protein [Rhodobacter sp.]MCA3512343.1 TraB/GumN family protein [Rhodobacter sp.]MCA3521654.1 TraB/GumN family protein [Rhodobacter sp.]MCA3521814.1 TraB/GumN family protein [Rhodobacter sp.]MCA3527125.1 TraB/GumN family protein [Rhodobacter sp.]
MLRFALACLVAVLVAVPASAMCRGRNLIDTLSAETQAGLRAAADAAPFARGNLWRATRGDQVLHLIGTFHLDDPRHDALMARLAPLIDGASTVLVEAGPAEEAALQAALAADPSLVFLTNGPTLPETLAPATWDRLKDALRARSIPPFLGAKMRPAYLSMLLSLPPCALTSATEPQNGLDRRIIARSRAQDIPLRALEPFSVVFDIFSDMTLSDQVALLELSLALDAQSEDVFATLTDAYFAEDGRMIWEFSRWQALTLPGLDAAQVADDFALMEDRMMSARNRAWIPVIEAALADGPALAAFGALHLSGEDGVLALLQQAGFAVERLRL